MNEYQTSLAYAMAATGRAGMQVQKDIYSLKFIIFMINYLCVLIVEIVKSELV